MSDQGWQPRRCAACGHPVGTHKSGGTRFPHPPRYGVCLAGGCPCREFVDPDDQDRAA